MGSALGEKVLRAFLYPPSLLGPYGSSWVFVGGHKLSSLKTAVLHGLDSLVIRVLRDPGLQGGPRLWIAARTQPEMDCGECSFFP